MRLRLGATIMACICAVLLFCSITRAAAPTDMVRHMLDSVMAIQADPSLQGPEFRNTRRAEIKKVIVTNFNFDDMVRHALATQWDNLTTTERSEFRSLFQDLFLDSYSRLVLDFLKKEKIAYNGEGTAPEGPTVKTMIQRVNEEIPVDYFLVLKGGRLQVRDVSIDGVSIVDNYRKTFSRIIKQESFEGLMKKMKLQQQAIQKS